MSAATAVAMPPGISASPVSVGVKSQDALREEREDEDAAVQAEAERDEQEDRRRQVAVA